MPKQVLETRDITKAFSHKRVLRGVDLTVLKGEIYVLFGANGVGKTTLIKVLTTLMSPDSGELRIFGKDVKGNKNVIKPRMGLVSHERYLYPNLTAYENLGFFATLYGVPGKEKRIKKLLKDFGLYHRSHDLVGQFSQGMMQRLSIARAIIHEPDLVFMDEPFSGLDIDVVDRLYDIIREQNGSGKTFFIITHDMDKGFKIATRCGLLSKGKIVHECKRSQRNEFSSIYRNELKGAVY
jgi:heme exporter protein A